MKKQKSSSKQIPIQLSANKKSHSINLKHHQPNLFVPYKIQWKNSGNTETLLYGTSGIGSDYQKCKQPFKSLQNCGNTGSLSNNGSKAFYQNMKNELLNIKQDVQKMILKQKKQKTLQNTQNNTTIRTNTDQQTCTSIPSSLNSTGYTKTINIKNKCQQQRIAKVQSLYQNIQKSLNNHGNSNNNRLIVGQSKYQQSTFINNILQDQLNSKLKLQQKYRSQNDGNSYGRTKSKSIATVFHNNGNVEDQNEKINIRRIVETNRLEFNSNRAIPRQQQLQNQQKQPNQQNVKTAKKQIFELDIKLPSFKDNKIINKLDEQKLKLVEQLKQQLSDLQKQLIQKQQDVKKSNQTIIKLSKQIKSLQQQIKATKQSHSRQIQVIVKQNKHTRNQYEIKINKLQNQLSNKQNSIINLKHTVTNNTKLIQELNRKNSLLIQQLTNLKNLLISKDNKLRKLQTQRVSKQSQNKHKQNVKSQRQLQLEQQNSKLKQKYKLKENQLYIYQQELKQAKNKIKQLKSELASNQELSKLKPSIQQTNISQSINLSHNQNQLEENHNLINQVKNLKSQNNELHRLNEQFKSELQKLNKLLNQKQLKINKLTKQNTQLNTKLTKTQEQNKKAIQDMINNPQLKNIGQQLSNKFSSMVEQTYSLKNKISHLQANIEQITLKNLSLQEQIKIYQEKLKQSSNGNRRLKIEDWDRLMEENELVKKQAQNIKQRLEQTKEFYDVQMMKKENQIYQLKQRIKLILQEEEIIQQAKLNNSQINLNKKHGQQYKGIRDYYHPNIKSLKNIQNLDTLLKQFKNCIQVNLQLQEQIKLIRQQNIQ